MSLAAAASVVDASIALLDREAVELRTELEVLRTMKSARPCGINALDLGLVPGVRDVDNGSILTAAIRDGKVTDTVHFPGGIYHATTAVDDCAREGLKFTGQGMTVWRPEGAYTVANQGTSPVIWNYRGAAGDAWIMRSVGCQLEGINFFRSFRKEPPAWDGSVGIRGICPTEGIPAGKFTITNCTFNGFEI